MLTGAPGPDGLPFLFYQKFWKVIKPDLIKPFRAFEDGNINMARLNYATVILIPKEPDTRNLKKYRVIDPSAC